MYLGDELVAEVATPRTGKMTLTYRPELLERLGPGALVLSATLPLRAERFSPAEAAPYLEGLLPDGWARAGLERRFDVHRSDSFSLLLALGRECAGAVSFVPTGEPPAGPAAPGSGDGGGVETRPFGLDDDEVASRLAGLEADPFGVDEATRVTLAGTPWKLPLTISPDGRWAAPTAGHPSTYLLRTEPPTRRGLVISEAWALEVMRRGELEVVDAEATTIGGRSVLVVRRFDRSIGPGGEVERTHQEDCCQALGASRSERDEHRGGPSLGEVADLLDELATDPERDLRRLAGWMVAGVVFGRIDATARDLALLYVDGTCELGPVATMAATADHPDRPRQLSLRVGSADDLDDVGRRQVVAEVSSWGIDHDTAVGWIDGTLARLDASLDGAREAADPGDDAVAACRARLTNLA